MLKVMNSLLHFFMKLFSFFYLIKRKVKFIAFKKKCICGENLSVSTSANCFVEGKGRISIGKNCDICCILSVKDGAIITIGDFSTVRYDTVIGAVNSIKIGNYVIISNNVHIYDNNNHPTSPLYRKKMCESGFYSSLWEWKHSDNKPIVIEDNVWIGERSTILKGVTIGKGSIVASNSVVVKNVPPYVIVAGNPAKIVKHLDSEL